MKTGYKTTEFYVSVATAVLGVAVSLGVLSPDQSSALAGSMTTIGGAIVAAAAAFGYSLSRGNAKRVDK